MLVSLLLCAGTIPMAIALLQRSGMSFGLPVAYLICLATIHLPGALAHWFHPGQIPGYAETEEGLAITSLCMLAFIAGIALIEWRQSALLRMRKMENQSLRKDPRFWRFCITGGLVIGFVLAPLSLIPSLGAVIQNAGLIWIAGALLALRFHSSRSGSSIAFSRWVALSLINPFLSLLGQGFLGYGVTAISQVYSVFLVRRRRLIRSVLIVAIASYLGLGVGITYLASRNEIRSAVWGGAGIDERLTAIGNVAGEIRSFDPNDLEQAKLLVLRLNQNFFVGAAALNIQAGRSQFLLGRTFVEAIAALVPRALWPDKPVVGGSGNLVSEATGIGFAEGTSVGIGTVMEAYINFGQAGCLALFAVLGALLRWLDLRAYRAEAAGQYRYFLTSLLPALALIQPGGSLAELTSSVLAAWIAALLWFEAWQRSQRQRPSPSISHAVAPR